MEPTCLKINIVKKMKMTPEDWAGKSLKEKYVIFVNLWCIKGESSSSKADDKRDLSFY